MSIQIKFFASLKETLNLNDKELAFDQIRCAEDVWLKATSNQPLPNNLLCAVNHQHVSLDHQIKDGDEVAFFPPVTGG